MNPKYHCISIGKKNSYNTSANPNVQIILATHSPAVIMEGWLDKVFEVSDLVTPIKTNESLQKCND
jgi:predicted ATP-binding protein involved in virulence